MDDEDLNWGTGQNEEESAISTSQTIVTDYSTHARAVLQGAETVAATAPGGIMTCEHLLLRLTSDPEYAAARVLSRCGFTAESIARTIAFIQGPLPAGEAASNVVLSPRVEHVLANAGIEARSRDAAQVDTLHLLFALVRERQGIAALALETPGVGYEPLGVAISQASRDGMTDPS